MKLIPGELHTHPNGGCLICATQNPPFHKHHVIPRASGGEDGPLALLCNDCHESIHDAARKYISAEEYATLTMRKTDSWTDSLIRKKAERLIRIILDSEKLVRGNSNKSTKINLTLSGERNRKLEALAERLQMGKQDTLLCMIDQIKQS